MFTLPEELFLLSLDEAHGVIHTAYSTRIGPCLAGTLLAEICLHGLVDLNEKANIILVDVKLTGDDLVDDVITTLNSSRKPHKPAHWIGELSEHSQPIIRRLSAALENLGVIYRDGKRYWLVAPYPPLGNQAAHAKYWLKARLRQLAILDYTPNTRELALLRLLQACGMLSLLFTKDERQAAMNRIHQLVEKQAPSFTEELVFKHLLTALPEFIQAKKP